MDSTADGRLVLVGTSGAAFAADDLEIPLRAGVEQTVGRGSSCSARVRTDHLSRRHARVFFEDGAWHVEDLGSTNGVHVNGERVDRARIADGDEVGFGPIRFRYEMTPASGDGTPAAPRVQEPPPDRATESEDGDEATERGIPMWALLAGVAGIAVIAGALGFWLADLTRAPDPVEARVETAPRAESAASTTPGAEERAARRTAAEEARRQSEADARRRAEEEGERRADAEAQRGATLEAEREAAEQAVEQAARENGRPPILENATAKEAVETGPRSAAPEGEDRARILGLLRQAQEDLNALRLSAPAGDNALERYRQVLAIDPDNATARKGLEVIVETYVRLAQREISLDRFERAEEYLDLAEEVIPDAPAVADARAHLAAARGEQ